MRTPKLRQNARVRQEANKRIAEVAASLDGEGHVFQFLCECDRSDCREVIRLSVTDYRKLGAGHRLLCVADHFEGPFGLVEAVGRDVYAVAQND
jgi:hypothetical protein